MLGRPRCPQCHQVMSSEEECGFFCAIEAMLRKIMFPAAKKRWACKNEYSYSNHQRVEEWENKYKPIFDKIEKNINSSARRFVERQAKKNDFYSTFGQLEERFGSRSKKVLNALGNAVGMPKTKKDGTPIKIRKRPPDYICCPNHYKYKINFNGAKVKRHKFLFFKEYSPGGISPDRSLF